MDENTGATALVVLVALSAFRLIEFVIGKYMRKDTTEQSNRTERRFQQGEKQLSDLHGWHDKTDVDGVHTWVIPRSWGLILVEIRDGIKELVNEIRKNGGIRK